MWKSLLFLFGVAFVHGCADASKHSFSVAIPPTLHSDGPVPYQLIILFTQEDCRICLFEAEYWERIHQEFSPRLEVKGLTQYDPEFVDSFSRSTGISFPIVQDAAGFETMLNQMAQSLGARGTPLKLLVDAEGKVLFWEWGNQDLARQKGLEQRIRDALTDP